MKNRIFNFDSPLVNLIFRIADLVLLNLITLVCMIPIFTIGPALKALAFTSLKMVRGEDGNVIKTFWRNFKLNFVQSMFLGFICLAVLFVILGDIYALIMLKSMFPWVAILASALVIIIALITLLYAIPMQGRFLNKIKDTLKNAFWLALLKLPHSLVMLSCWLLLPSFYYFVSENFFPLLLALGISLPAYLNAMIYEPFFQEIEDRVTRNGSCDTASDMRPE